MERDRHPSPHPQRWRHLRGADRRADVALGRRPPRHAGAAVDILLRPGHDEAQGVLRPSRGAPMTEYREADFMRLKTGSIAQRPNRDVARGLADGTFGMAEDPGREVDAGVAEGSRAGRGMGEAVAECLKGRGKLAAPDVSVLLAAAARGIPVTVHATVGADITHQHPP